MSEQRGLPLASAQLQQAAPRRPATHLEQVARFSSRKERRDVASDAGSDVSCAHRDLGSADVLMSASSADKAGISQQTGGQSRRLAWAGVVGWHAWGSRAPGGVAYTRARADAGCFSTSRAYVRGVSRYSTSPNRLESHTRATLRTATSLTMEVLRSFDAMEPRYCARRTQLR